MKAIRLGITGGIGSGKSIVSRLLQAMDVPVYSSDVEAKRLMQTDVDIRAGLTALVGKELYTDDVLNRSLLSSYMFGYPERVVQVNSIVHPRVRVDFRQWADKQAFSVPVLGIESAILLEAGFREHFNGETICIIEWAENAGTELPAPDIAVTLDITGDGRTAHISASSGKGIHCLETLRFSPHC